MGTSNGHQATCTRPLLGTFHGRGHEAETHYPMYDPTIEPLTVRSDVLVVAVATRPGN